MNQPPTAAEQTWESPLGSLPQAHARAAASGCKGESSDDFWRTSCWMLQRAIRKHQEVAVMARNPKTRRRLPALKPRQVLKALQRAGFVLHHTTGGHRILKHPANPALRVTVPYHNKDLKLRTLESIVKQTGLTGEQFRKLL